MPEMPFWLTMEPTTSVTVFDEDGYTIVVRTFWTGPDEVSVCMLLVSYADVKLLHQETVKV